MSTGYGSTTSQYPPRRLMKRMFLGSTSTVPSTTLSSMHSAEESPGFVKPDVPRFSGLPNWAFLAGLSGQVP